MTTKEQLERIIQVHIIPKFEKTVNQALAKADKQLSEIGRVVLCGGSMHIPAIQQWAHPFFNQSGTIYKMFPEAQVAKGLTRVAKSFAKGKP